MKLMRLGVLGYALRIYLWPSKVDAAIVNATIDDGLGDSLTHQQVHYYPNQSFWYNQSSDVFLDKSQAFNKTFTYVGGNNSEPIGISMNFTGTAIYVFFILFGWSDAPSRNGANFTLDSNEPVSFSKNVNDTEYDVLVFSHTSLSNTLHTLNITADAMQFIYVNFDYAIYTYDNGVSTITSSLSAVTTKSSAVTITSSALTTTSQAPSTTVTVRGIPVGAIVGGIVGGITLLALIISLLFCWHHRGGHDALQSVRGNGGGEPLITQFNAGAGSLAASASGVPYTQPLAVSSKSPMATVTVSGGESSNADHQAKMRNGHRNLYSGGVVLSPSGSQQLPPSSEKALPSTSNSRVLGTSRNDHSASPSLPSALNVPRTRDEIRRARQEDLDNQLRVVHHNIVQLEESSTGPGRSVSLRRQTSGGAEIIGEEMQMSVPDMQEAIRLQREQIRVLREQQQSAWAQGFSDDPPPGYTPMEMGMQISREASS